MFKDHFSSQSKGYAEFRPAYPEGMFAYLAGLTPARQLAWDCATGTGQAAGSLAEHFERVIATDASERQIANAPPHDRIDYRVEPAEGTDIGSGTLDLIVVAQALHWLDLGAFYGRVCLRWAFFRGAEELPLRLCGQSFATAGSPVSCRTWREHHLVEPNPSALDAYALAQQV
jgi:SAM-dependent methyltransferase